ncbi:penicillin-binding protein 2 [Breznakiellaceae bacterium SP9]
MSTLHSTSQNSEGDDRLAKRIMLLKFVFIIVFCIYAVRLFSMQILNGQYYIDQAQTIARRTTVIPSQRGEIYDRSMTRPLALNTDSFAVNIIPAEVEEEAMPALIERLSAILSLPKEQIERSLPQQYYGLYQPVELAKNIPYETIAVMAELKDTLPGVTWQSKPMRNYPQLRSLSHIIGYVGDITRDELTMLYNQGYQQGNLIGKSGIERQYDYLLRGTDGKETRTVDVRGRHISGGGSAITETPVMGKNLVLTIDTAIQTLAEKALGERMGSVVVLRPSTGEILAMVSYPWYDPNMFYSNDFNSQYQAMSNDVNKPFLNRAIQSNYPPASTFKIVMTAGIIAENVFPTDQLIDCHGELVFGDRLWRCHIRKPGHGKLNLSGAMAQSCDIYYWTVGRENLGVERIVSYALDFGFGEASGIDLPGEISGFIPTPLWKDRKFHERWLGGDTMNMSIGQSYTLVTPIQMADMVSMVVNNGVIYQPHILKEVRDPQTGAIEAETTPKILHQSELVSQNVFRRVKQDMRGVISSGTAHFPVDIKAVQIAGKTGTAEVGLADRWHSWFAGYAPYETSKPQERVVVSVMVEASNKWEWWAVYASAIIFNGIFTGQSYEDSVRTLGFQYLMPQSRRE